MGRRLVLTALVLPGLVMLSACSSGKPASHAVAWVGGVVLVGPYTHVFAGPLPVNPASVAVLEGFREGQVLWEGRENARHLVPAARDHVTGQALTDLTSALRANKARNVVPAGVDRFFMTRVTVVTCDDGSKLKEENQRTGKVNLACC